MSIGLKRPFTKDEQECCELQHARFCQACECVTKLEQCFLCDSPTIPHPELSEAGPRYCLHCADEFPVDQLRVITFEHNPYEQDEDGGINTICLKCLAKEDNDPSGDSVSGEFLFPRDEHLEWSKKRALQYCDIGDVTQAFTSLASDLRKHPETAEHMGLELGMMQLVSGHLSSPDSMRRFIEGFN